MVNVVLQLQMFYRHCIPNYKKKKHADSDGISPVIYSYINLIL